MCQVNTELNLSSTATISLNDSAVRTLFGVSSGQISMSDGYGKSNEIKGQATYTSPGSYTFTVPSGITSVSAMAVGSSTTGEGSSPTPWKTSLRA